jgi:putrescine aminotransferase
MLGVWTALRPLSPNRQGAGGVIVRASHPAPYSQKIQRIYEHGILLIADEVITTSGVHGPWFGSENYGIHTPYHDNRQGVIVCLPYIGGSIVWSGAETVANGRF